MTTGIPVLLSFDFKFNYLGSNRTARAVFPEFNNLTVDETALQSALEAVFARFEDLVGVEAFDALRENAEAFTPEELEEKCFAIRGRSGTPAKFSHEEKAPKLQVVREDNRKKEPYGGIFAHFGIEAE